MGWAIFGKALLSARIFVLRLLLINLSSQTMTNLQYTTIE